MDTQRRLLQVLVHPANQQENVAAMRQPPLWQRLRLFLFDSGYNCPALLRWCQLLFSVDSQVTNRARRTAFVVQPKR